MLTIQLPDDHEKKQRRRRRRLYTYLAAGLIYMVLPFLAYNTTTLLWITADLATGWWIWAVLTDPETK